MGRTLLMCRGFQELTGAGIRGRAVNGSLKGHWGKGDREARFSKYTEREMDSAQTSPVLLTLFLLSISQSPEK